MTMRNKHIRVSNVKQVYCVLSVFKIAIDKVTVKMFTQITELR